MWFFRYHARRIVRSFMKPIDPARAEKYLFRSRLLYIISGLSALSLSVIVYQINKEKADELISLDTTPSHKKLRLRGDNVNVKISRINLGGKIEHYEYNNKDYIDAYNEKLAQYNEKHQIKTE